MAPSVVCSAVQVVAAGGLLVLGTSLQEGERIELQLRGRAGRQGDPGTTQLMFDVGDPLISNFGMQGKWRSMCVCIMLLPDLCWCLCCWLLRRVLCVTCCACLHVCICPCNSAGTQYVSACCMALPVPFLAAAAEQYAPCLTRVLVALLVATS